MPTVPSHPEVIYSADLADYFQFRKDTGADLTATGVMVRETGEVCVAIALDGTTYICGPEYNISVQFTAATGMPWSATAADVLSFHLPLDRQVFLTRWDVTIGGMDAIAEGTKWDITLKEIKTSSTTTLANVDTDQVSANTDYPQSVTTFDANPTTENSTRLTVTVTETGSCRDLSVYTALRVRDVLATLT